ncbi:MAG: hypothetical protein JZU65_22310 [Chlorobium sp.]|nr:hypothetical protein [Chlorobium sp.]
MDTEWTEARRAQQAANIRARQPWKKSTGPKSEEGKAKVSQNSVKHGLRGGVFRKAEALLVQNNRALKGLKG